MKPALTSKQAVLAILAGLAFGVAVATVMTVLDWRLNPGGLFHNDQGTHWAAVRETAFSWFLPVALATSAVTAIALSLLRRAK